MTILQKLRSARHLPSLIKFAAKFGRPRHAFWLNGAGIGDNLLLTTVAHEHYRRTSRPIDIISPHPELFYGNPSIRNVYPLTEATKRAFRFYRAKMTALTYATYSTEPFEHLIPAAQDRHIATEFCRSSGIEGAIAVRPYFYLTKAEEDLGTFAANHVLIQSSGMDVMFPSTLKQWPHQCFQKVVELLRGEFQFIQIGSLRDPPLENVKDFRGRTNIRQLAAMLKSSIAFIGLEGFPMHLARSVDCRSVIVFGGRIQPSQTGYICNENLFTKLPCSPCWRMNHCELDRLCLTTILPEHVVCRFNTLIQRGRTDPDVHFEQIRA